MAIQSGQRLGPYEIVGPLGAGGMGEVYRAKDTRLGREVAIKVLPSHLTHPHICTLYDVGSENGTDFLVKVDGLHQRGTAPVWSPVGKEIFYLSGMKLVAVPVGAKGDEFVAGDPKVLFENHEVFTFAASKDGKRFIAAENPNPGAEPRLDIVLNWFAEVRRKVQEAEGR